MISAPLFWLFIVTFGFLCYLWQDKEKKGLKKIPGPKGLPFLGNIHQLGSMPYKQFNKWTEEFGAIYQVKLAGQLNVVISDPKMAKEMFMTETYSGRPNFKGLNVYEDETQQLGIVNAEGELWEVHRRFLLRQLRDFGFGKAAMENLILEEVNETIARFKENEGKPIYDTKKVMNIAVINALWSVVSCQRFQHDDPKLLSLVAHTHRVFSDIFENGGIILFLPWLRHIFPDWSGYTGLRKVLGQFRFWFEETLEEHKKSFDENNMRDFIDVYLLEMKKQTDPNSVFYGKEAERQLIASLADLFLAGSDTLSTTLAWSVMYLCKYPEVQRNFQNEIKAVTNDSRHVSISDRPNMPYTLAIIDEVLRITSIAPNGVQHRAVTGRVFQGYYIPKDAWILPNMYHMHHSPKAWINPETFRPERFLTADGKYKKSDNLMPFQIGRRQCVGETMARDTIFLYLTNIFQRFTVSFDPNSPDPTTESLPNFILVPQPYSIIMTDRLVH